MPVLKHYATSKMIAIITAIVTITVGIIVLAGWYANIPWLKSPIPETVSMKANTALGFLLCGISLLLLQIKSEKRWSEVLAVAIAIGILLIGLLTTLEYFIGWELGIDQFLIKDSADAVATSHPGRMAPNTAVCFLFLSFSLLLKVFYPRKLILLIEFFTIFVGSIAVLSLFGYVSGLGELTGPVSYTQMAEHTAITFLLLAVGMLLTAFDYGAFPFLLEYKVSGFLTAAIAILLFLTFLSFSQITAMQKAAKWQRRSGQLKYEAQRFLMIIDNMEFAASGYALTGEDDHEISFEKNLNAVKLQLELLDKLTTANPKYQKRLQALSALTENSIEAARRILNNYKESGFTNLAEIIDTSKRSEVLADIHNLITEIIIEENSQSHERNSLEDTTATQTRTVLIIGILFQVSLLGVLFMVINREIKIRRQNEQRYAAIAENLPKGIVHIFDKNFRYVFNAGEMLEELGLSNEQLVGKSIYEVFPNEIASLTEERYKSVLKGEVISFEGDFGDRSFLVRAAPILNNKNEVEHILALSVDITEKKRIEKEIKESEAKFRNIFENSATGKSMTSVDGKVHVNKQFARILGYSVEEMSQLNWKNLTHPDDIKESEQIVASILAGENKAARYQKRYIHKNGRIVWTDISTFLQRDDNDQPLFFITSVSDITDRKNAEENLKKLNVRLEAANKELESFSYSVSHDLRAPLRAVTGFSQKLLKNYEDKLDDEGKRLTNIIVENGQKMGRLIDDLLGFSRLSRKDVNRSFIDMEKLARNTFSEITRGQNQQHLDFRLKKLASAQGDPAMLRQVFANLLSNAVKFSRNKPKAVIEVDCKISKKENIYFVKDNGAGFNMQYADKLFGVFQRLHSEKEFEGTGIGLSLVQRIIHKHGGRIWAEAEENKGATFYFTLPKYGGNEK